MEERIQQIEVNLELIKTLLLGNKKTLTLEEACEYTGYKLSYMYKLTSRGEIPHYKRGKKVFFDKDELDAWMISNKVQDLSTVAKRSIRNI
jgi:excisionase family DNA binding protein